MAACVYERSALREEQFCNESQNKDDEKKTHGSIIDLSN